MLDRKTGRIKQIDFSFSIRLQLTIEDIVPYRDMLVLPSTQGIFKLDRENLHTSYLLDDSLLQQNVPEIFVPYILMTRTAYGCLHWKKDCFL